MPSSEKPTAEIINDDEALDAWYEKYTRDIAIRIARSTGGRTGFQMSDDEKGRAIATFGGDSGP